MERAAVAIVAQREDPLAYGVGMALRSAGEPVLSLHPRSLAGTAVSVTDGTLYVAGWPIAGVLFRASPEGPFSEDFHPQDQAFGDAETRALWMAALNLDTVLAMNRYGAEAWFESGGMVWRRALLSAGVPVTPFAWGDACGDEWSLWHTQFSARPRPAPGRTTRRALGAALSPHVEERVSILVCGAVVAGRTTPAVLAAGRVLGTLGLEIVEVATDEEDRVLRVSPHPSFTDWETVERAVPLLFERYHAHLHRR